MFSGVNVLSVWSFSLVFKRKNIWYFLSFLHFLNQLNQSKNFSQGLQMYIIALLNNKWIFFALIRTIFFWNWLRVLYYKVICRKCCLLLSDFHVEIRAKLFDVKLASICIHTFQASGQRMSQGLGMLCQTTCYCNQNKSHKSRRSRQAERKPVYVHLI